VGLFDSGVLCLSNVLSYKCACDSSISKQNRKNQYKHLTNYAINKKNENFQAPSEDIQMHGKEANVKSESGETLVGPDEQEIEHAHSLVNEMGSKRSLTSVYRWLDANGFSGDKAKRDIHQVIVKTILSALPANQHAYKVTFPESRDSVGASCFTVLGFDIMLDSDCDAWLIETNELPSFETDSSLDFEIKMAVIKEALDMVCPTSEEMRLLKELSALSPGPPGIAAGSKKEERTKAEMEAARQSIRSQILNQRIDHERNRACVFELVYPAQDSDSEQVYARCFAASFEVFRGMFGGGMQRTQPTQKSWEKCLRESSDRVPSQKKDLHAEGDRTPIGANNALPRDCTKQKSRIETAPRVRQLNRSTRTRVRDDFSFNTYKDIMRANQGALFSAALALTRAQESSVSTSSRPSTALPAWRVECLGQGVWGRSMGSPQPHGRFVENPGEKVGREKWIGVPRLSGQKNPRRESDHTNNLKLDSVWQPSTYPRRSHRATQLSFQTLAAEENNPTLCPVQMRPWSECEQRLSFSHAPGYGQKMNAVRHFSLQPVHSMQNLPLSPSRPTDHESHQKGLNPERGFLDSTAIQAPESRETYHLSNEQQVDRWASDHLNLCPNFDLLQGMDLNESSAESSCSGDVRPTEITLPHEVHSHIQPCHDGRGADDIPRETPHECASLHSSLRLVGNGRAQRVDGKEERTEERYVSSPRRMRGEHGVGETHMTLRKLVIDNPHRMATAAPSHVHTHTPLNPSSFLTSRGGMQLTAHKRALLVSTYGALRQTGKISFCSTDTNVTLRFPSGVSRPNSQTNICSVATTQVHRAGNFERDKVKEARMQESRGILRSIRSAGMPAGTQLEQVWITVLQHCSFKRCNVASMRKSL
jgi:hypothetical protein